jgi:uncharacterized protein
MLLAAGKYRWTRRLGYSIVVLLIALAAQSGALAQPLRAPIRDPNFRVWYHPWSYKELSERGIVMQKLDYSCGAAVMATICKYYWGDKIGEEYFLELLPQLDLNEEELKDRIENGLTLTDLRNLANKGGYDATMGRVTFQQLAQAKVPLVVGIIVNKEDPKYKHEHFVVYRGFDGFYVYLADPIRGQLRVPGDKFIDMWQRNAILAVIKPATPVKNPNPMGIRWSEVDRGWLNEQVVRKNYLWTPGPNPLRTTN